MTVIGVAGELKQADGTGIFKKIITGKIFKSNGNGTANAVVDARTQKINDIRKAVNNGRADGIFAAGKKAAEPDAQNGGACLDSGLALVAASKLLGRRQLGGQEGGLAVELMIDVCKAEPEHFQNYDSMIDACRMNGNPNALAGVLKHLFGEIEGDALFYIASKLGNLKLSNPGDKEFSGMADQIRDSWVQHTFTRVANVLGKMYNPPDYTVMKGGLRNSGVLTRQMQNALMAYPMIEGHDQLGIQMIMKVVQDPKINMASKARLGVFLQNNAAFVAANVQEQ